MRHFFCLLLLSVWLSLPLAAQREQDFASRYMSLYGGSADLTCTTISPLMMEKMMKLDRLDGNDSLRQVLAQLRSIRVVTGRRTAEAEDLLKKSRELALTNHKRYKLYAEADEKSIFVRTRGKVTVEIVLMLKAGGTFVLTDLTGNMTRSFIEELTKLRIQEN